MRDLIITVEQPVGGLIGYQSDPYGICQINDVYANVNIAGDSSVGGLIGFSNINIFDSFAVSNISASGDYVGGLVGWSQNNIFDSFAVSNISASGDYVGGAVGFNDYSGLLHNIYIADMGNNIGCNYTSADESYEVISDGCTEVSGSDYFLNIDNAPMNVWAFPPWSRYCHSFGYPALSWEEASGLIPCLRNSQNSQNAGGSSGGGGSQNMQVSESQLNNEYSSFVQAGSKIGFVIDGENHTLLVNNVSGNTVSITISSAPQTFNLFSGEEKKVELNNDNYYDLLVKVDSIIGEFAKLTLKKIHEEITAAENELQNNNQNEAKNPRSIVLIFLVIVAVIVLIVLLLICLRHRKKLFEVHVRFK